MTRDGSQELKRGGLGEQDTYISWMAHTERIVVPLWPEKFRSWRARHKAAVFFLGSWRLKSWSVSSSSDVQGTNLGMYPGANSHTIISSYLAGAKGGRHPHVSCSLTILNAGTAHCAKHVVAAKPSREKGGNCCYNAGPSEGPRCSHDQLEARPQWDLRPRRGDQRRVQGFQALGFRVSGLGCCACARITNNEPRGCNQEG